MFCKRKSKYRKDTCCNNVLLTYILKGIPEGCTISIVDITHSEQKILCSNAKGYESKKMYGVISIDKFDIKDQIKYFIRVIETNN